MIQRSDSCGGGAGERGGWLYLRWDDGVRVMATERC